MATYEVYTYGNPEAFVGVFNAVASMMGSDTFTGAMHLATLLGAITVLVMGVFAARGGLMLPLNWILGINIITLVLFMPRSDVLVVDRLSSAPVSVVSNVPHILAVLAHSTTLLGDKMTQLTETAFQVIPDAGSTLPQTLSYQQNGVMFGARLITEARKAAFSDPKFRTDFTSYVRDCLVPDFNGDPPYKDAAAFGQATDLWAAMGDTNPARYTYVGGDVRTCPEAYNNLNARMPDHTGIAMARVAMKLEPYVSLPDAVDKFTTAGPDAAARGMLGAAAADAGVHIRQNAIINMLNDSYLDISRQYNDPASVTMATAQAAIAAQTNASWITSGTMAESALPKFRGIAQALSYALFPFVIILGLTVPLAMFGRLVAGWIKFMASLELWPPLYAIINYFGTLAWSKSAAAAAAFGDGGGGLATTTAAAIYSTAISDQGIVGYICLSIPVLSWALVNGMQGFIQGFAAGTAVQQAVHSTAGQAAAGNLAMGNTSFEQQSLAPSATSPWRRTYQDANGTTHQVGELGGAHAIQMLKNSTSLSGVFSQRQASELSTAANSSIEAGRGETITAATQATAALGGLISRSRDKANTTGLEQSWGKGEAGEFAQTHGWVRGQAQDLSRKYGISEGDASKIVIGANAGLGLDGIVSQDKKHHFSSPGSTARSAPSSGGEEIGPVTKQVRGQADFGIDGKLNSEYLVKLERAYDEVAKSTTQNQAEKVNRYAERLAHDETARKAIAATDRDAEQASAGLTEARSHAVAGEAHIRKGEALREEARRATTTEGSMGYDWMSDPSMTPLAMKMIGQMQDAYHRGAGANPTNIYDHQAGLQAAQTVLKENEILLSSPLYQPTRYASGKAIQWQEDGLQKQHQVHAAAPELQDNTSQVHQTHLGKVGKERLDGDGVVNLTGPNIKPLQGQVAAGTGQIKGNTDAAFAMYDKAAGGAKSRFEGKAFDPRDATLKNRDGEFGSYKSTADKAAGNAARDGERSVENAMEGVKDTARNAAGFVKKLFN